MFRKEDIKEGYLLEVEIKDSETRAVAKTFCMVTYNERNRLAASSPATWFDISFLNENLISEDKTRKVTKIYGRSPNWSIHKGIPDERHLLWERSNDYTEYTVEEIEKLLGKKIKIKAE